MHDQPDPPQSSRPLTTRYSDDLVLGTVNAPYMLSITAEELAHALATGEVDTWLVHLAGFFFEVRPALIRHFVERHEIPREAVVAAYREVMRLTGDRPRPELDALLGLPEPPGA